MSAVLILSAAGGARADRPVPDYWHGGFHRDDSELDYGKAQAGGVELALDDWESPPPTDAILVNPLDRAHPIVESSAKRTDPKHVRYAATFVTPFGLQSDALVLVLPRTAKPAVVVNTALAKTMRRRATAGLGLPRREINAYQIGILDLDSDRVPDVVLAMGCLGTDGNRADGACTETITKMYERAGKKWKDISPQVTGQRASTAAVSALVVVASNATRTTFFGSSPATAVAAIRAASCSSKMRTGRGDPGKNMMVTAPRLHVLSLRFRRIDCCGQYGGRRRVERDQDDLLG